MATSYRVGEAPWEQNTQPSVDSFAVGSAPWEQPVAPIKKKGIMAGYKERVAEDYKQAGQDIISSVNKSADALSKASMRTGNTKERLSAIGGLARTGLRTAGAVAGAAFSPVLEAPGIKQAAEFVVGKIAQNPEVQSVITSATELAKKYPEQAKDLQNIIDIASLGAAPKVASTLGKEAGAIGSDIAQGAKIALTPSEEAVQKNIISLFQKSIKPTAKKTLTQSQRYENDVIGALKTIKNNADGLNIEDATGELVTGRAPKTINELAQATEQTKQLVFNQYDELAKQAGTQGVKVDARPIADEVLKVAQNKALQITNPEIIKYAEGWAERLKGLGELDTQTTQEVIKNLNNSLTAFYRNPSFDAATKVSVDAGIVNLFRKSLDDVITGATGKEYQALKSQYASLKAIENDVIKAAARDAKKSVKGLLDYTDMFTSGQMVAGILSLNPAMFTKGAVERGFKQYIKFLNDPNRAVSNIFDKIGTDTAQVFTPKSTTVKTITNGLNR